MKNIKTLAVTGLAALSIGCSSNDTFKVDMDAIWESGLGTAIITQGTAAALRSEGKYEAARAMENIGRTMGQVDAAKAGKSEVNVYVQGSREAQKEYTCLTNKGIARKVYLDYKGRFRWMKDPSISLMCQRLY